jgi:ABC-type multidrug transport system permease subunit/uncharacterized protein YoxC
MALRIHYIAGKDLRIYQRQRKTLALMVLTPVLIMLIVGSVFAGGAERGLKNVRLGVTGVQTREGALIVESLSKEGMFTIEELNVTPSEMDALVSQGIYSAGIVLPENQTTPLRLYLDDSKLQIAPVISSVFLTLTEKLSFEITLAFIEELWTSLQKMKAQMDPLANEVRRVNATINEINADAEEIQGSMNALDINGLRNSLREMGRALDDMERDLGQSRIDLNGTREELRELNTSVGDISAESSELRDEMKVVVDSINSTNQALLELQSELQEVYNTTCGNLTALDPRCITIQQSIQQINFTRNLLLNRTSRITRFYENLNRVAERSAQLQGTLSKIDVRLERMDSSIASYLNRIDDLRQEIMPIEEAVTELEDIRQRSTATFREVNRLTREINRNADELVAALEESKETLEEVVARPPTAVVSPIVWEKVRVFEGKSYLEFLLPGITAIVLMFVCLLLASITIVQEKSGGTLVRTLLSPIRLHDILLGKIVAILVISLFQAMIIMGIARFVYGIGIPTQHVTPLFKGVLIYSASFTAIGMALATFADSENTAMLSSLVLSVPMLFLNGVFFPFEMMPPAMNAIGRALPITLGIEMFRDILLYGKGITIDVPFALGAYLVFAYLVAYVQMRRLALD